MFGTRSRANFLNPLRKNQECPYGVDNGTRVQIVGYFEGDAAFEKRKTLGYVRFYVVDVPSSYEALLGKKSALLLGVLRLGIGASSQFNAVSVSSNNIAYNYPALF